MNTRKIQLAWITGIIENLPQDLRDKSGDPFVTTAENVKRLRYGRLTLQEAATDFLKGCGLHGFPVWTEEHEDLLRSWGYTPTEKMTDQFFPRSASLLVEVLQRRGLL